MSPQRKANALAIEPGSTRVESVPRVKSCRHTSSFDHYLVARAQACGTGANAHDLHALLGNYCELCLLAEEDPTVLPRIERIEQKLRAFCQSRTAARENCATPEYVECTCAKASLTAGLFHAPA